MSDNKQSIQFDLSYNQGCTCIGCAMIADLIVEEEFTADEIALMKQLVSQVDDEDYSQGIMPLLKEGAHHSMIASTKRHVMPYSSSWYKMASAMVISS